MKIEDYINFPDTMAKNKYQISKGLKKTAVNALFVIIAGCASVYGDNALWLAVAPLLTFIANYIKHK